MIRITIGIDIAKHHVVTARLWDNNYRHKTFDNNAQGFAAFGRWLQGFGDPAPWVCLEATGAYSIPLAEFLVEQGYRVSVVNPAKIHAFAKSAFSRTKTDKADAKLIARYCLSMQPAPWTPPPRPLLEMRQMERHRLDTADPIIVASLTAVLETVDQELKSIRQQINDLIDSDPDLKPRRDLLQSIPGIGPLASAYLLTALSAHDSFTHAKQAVAYVGLAPRLQESGKWIGKTRLSKTGNPALRKALYLPALTAWQHNPVIRAFCLRLKAQGKNGKAIACAAMRKLIHLAFAILKSSQPFNPKLTLA